MTEAEYRTAEMVVKQWQLGATVFLGLVGVVVAAFQITIARKQVVIAEGQAETAAAKVKLDLYDRRYKAYQAVELLLVEVRNHSVPDDRFEELRRGFSEHSFLFKTPLREWLTSMVFSIRNTNSVRQEHDADIERAAQDQSYAMFNAGRISDANEVIAEIHISIDSYLANSISLFGEYLDFAKNL